MNSHIQSQMLSVAQCIERQVDQAIDELDNMGVDELAVLRKRRMEQLKRINEQQAEWRRLGHGQYEELPEEKRFFDTIKQSKNVVVHFYRSSTMRCRIFDMHLTKLAPQHLETRFVKIDAEKCPFLVERLRVRTIPTLVLIQDGVMVDKVVGFSQLGNCDDFRTEVLEWRLAQNELVDYEGDLSTMPSAVQTRHTNRPNGRIRGRDNDDLDLEEDGLERDSLISLKTQVQTSAVAELSTEEARELGLNAD